MDRNFSMSLFRDGLNDEILSFFLFLVNAISYVVERGADIVKSTLGRNCILPAVDLFFIGVFFLSGGSYCIHPLRELPILVPWHGWKCWEKSVPKGALNQ